jgi:hypothetical protein
VHPDDKENYGKKDKTELGDINKYTLNNGKKEEIDHFNKGIKKEKKQAWQKFMFIPFQGQHN